MLEGHLRIKAPTTVTTEFLGALFTDFLQQHPGVTMDVRWLITPSIPSRRVTTVAWGRCRYPTQTSSMCRLPATNS